MEALKLVGIVDDFLGQRVLETGMRKGGAGQACKLSAYKEVVGGRAHAEGAGSFVGERSVVGPWEAESGVRLKS